MQYSTAQFAAQHALFNVMCHCRTIPDNPKSVGPNFVSCHATTLTLDVFVEMAKDQNRNTMLSRNDHRVVEGCFAALLIRPPTRMMSWSSRNGSSL